MYSLIAFCSFAIAFVFLITWNELNSHSSQIPLMVAIGICILVGLIFLILDILRKKRKIH